MQLVYVLGAIPFAVRISLHISKVKPGPDHPMHIPKLACTKELSM